MTTKAAYKLKPGDKVLHKNWGICSVVRIIEDFGPVIRPDEVKDQVKLCLSSGMPLNTSFLATDYRRNLKSIKV